MRILVDGYNLLRRRGPGREADPLDLEAERTELLDRLAAYRRVRSHAITVIFDGRDAPPGLDREGRHRGILVRYSRQGETADQVIAGLAREAGRGLVVVTSDRDLARAVERSGATAIAAEIFAAKMDAAELEDLKGEEEEREGGASRARRGPSHRPDKAGRRRQAAQDRL